MRRAGRRRSGPRRVRDPHAARRCAALLVVALASTGCAGDPVDTPPPEGPFLYLVLGERSVDVSRADSAARRQHAMLLSLTPEQTVEFRSALRFAMEDGRGRRFGWEGLPRTGAVVREPGPDSLHPNWVLPETPWAGLGAGHLEPGESYTLHLDTEGRAVWGATTMPGPIAAWVTGTGDVLVWGSVEGAAGYRVMIDDETLLVTDSVMALSAGQQQATRIIVEALDPNAWAYHTDPRVGAAGLQGAFGVFGAVTRDTVRQVDPAGGAFRRDPLSPGGLPSAGGPASPGA